MFESRVLSANETLVRFIAYYLVRTNATVVSIKKKGTDEDSCTMSQKIESVC